MKKIEKPDLLVGYVFVILLAIAIGIALLRSVPQQVLESTQWPLWAQAVGSVGAIIGAYILGRQQLNHAVVQRAMAAIDKRENELKAVFTLAEAFVSGCKRAQRKIEDKRNGAQELDEVRRRFILFYDAISTALKEVPFHQQPYCDVFREVLLISGTAERYLSLIILIDEATPVAATITEQDAARDKYIKKTSEYYGALTDLRGILQKKSLPRMSNGKSDSDVRDSARFACQMRKTILASSSARSFNGSDSRRIASSTDSSSASSIGSLLRLNSMLSMGQRSFHQQQDEGQHQADAWAPAEPVVRIEESAHHDVTRALATRRKGGRRGSSSTQASVKIIVARRSPSFIARHTCISRISSGVGRKPSCDD